MKYDPKTNTKPKNKDILIPTTIDGMLVHVVEECAEVQKAICKIQRFGFGDKDTEHLLAELDDLQWTVKRLLKQMDIVGHPAG
jgi:NTP pyrophosphatase (non-canonical NTP hydrolase)